LTLRWCWRSWICADCTGVWRGFEDGDIGGKLPMAGKFSDAGDGSTLARAAAVGACIGDCRDAKAHS
jgi:hypothetical protein